MSNETEVNSEKAKGFAQYYGEHLALQAILRAVIDDLEKRHGATFKDDLHRRVLSLIRHIPQDATIEGHDFETREAANSLADRLIGRSGNRVPRN